MIIKNIIIICLLLACFIPITISDSPTPGIFLIESFEDWQRAGFNDSSLPCYTENALTLFFMPIALKKEDVANLQDKDVEHTFKYINGSFYDRLRDISFEIIESETYYAVIYKMEVYASDVPFSVDFLPKIKGETYDRYAYWNSSFLKRMDLWINSSQVTGSQTNKPVLVYFNSNSSLSTYADTNGHDISFVDTTNTTEYYTEKVFYNAGTLWAWVNMSFSNSANTHFNMYYNATNVQPKTLSFMQSVWDTNFFNAVYHMYDLTNSAVNDSTSNNFDNSKKGANEPNEVTGEVYNSQEYDGTNDFIGSVDSTVLFPNANSWAISFWFEPDSQTSDDRIFTSHHGASAGTGHCWRFDGTNLEDYFRDGDNNVLINNLLILPSYDAYYFGVSTFDGSVHNAYVDNVQYLRLVDDYKGVGTFDFLIGDYDKVSEAVFDGEIDEFFIYCNQMSRDFFNASYNNMNNKTAGASGFVILGDIEDYTAPTANTKPTVENHSIVNGTVGVNWTECNLTFTVNDTEGNTTYGNVTVLQNGSVTQTKNLGSFQNATLFIDMCKFNCSTEHIVHINVSDSGGLVNLTWINFSSYTCNVTPTVECDCSEIRTIIREELNTYNALKEDDTVELSVISAQFAIIINLLLFFFLFWIGYESKKRSGGAFMLISGFILIALEFSLVSYLNATYVVPFITPLAFLIMLLGGRKLLYKPSDEKHTPESR